MRESLLVLILFFLSGCSILRLESGSENAQIAFEKITINKICKGTGITFFAIGREGKESREVSDGVVSLTEGDYKLFFRVANLSRWKGKCRIIEEVITHTKYNASTLNVSVEPGVKYEFKINDEREPVFNGS
jgi:hypothetical protein